MTNYELARIALKETPRQWLVTGAAGFIGSNLVETLLKLGQTVVGLDNFSTGKVENLQDVENAVSPTQWEKFSFIEGDICDIAVCRRAVNGVDFVLHHAALGSVPRSINDPAATNASNVTGMLNMLIAAKDAAVKSFIYAASSSTYGDHPALPRVEETIGNPLSPYAVSKYVNELYAGVFAKNYGFKTIGLRYFNVFGKRQNPDGAYAAVIPKWISAMIENDQIFINGDGQTSRDFCYIDNVIQMNILAALADDNAKDRVYNVAVGESTTLNQLWQHLKMGLAEHGVFYERKPVYRPFRAGDVKYSLAETKKAETLLGYDKKIAFSDGIRLTISAYLNHNG